MLPFSLFQRAGRSAGPAPFWRIGLAYKPQGSTVSQTIASRCLSSPPDLFFLVVDF